MSKSRQDAATVVLLADPWRPEAQSIELWSALLGDRFELRSFRLLGQELGDLLNPSQRPGEVNLTRLCALLEKLENPVTLLGVGAAATLALRGAALTPEQVAGVIVVAPQFLNPWPRLAALAARNDLVFCLYWLLGNPAAYPLFSLDRILPGRSGLSRAWLRAYLREVHSSSNPPLIAGVRAPVLLIAGDEDPLSSAQACETLNATLETSHLLRCAGAGRFPHLEDPQLVRQAILPFLADVSREDWTALLQRRWRQFWRRVSGRPGRTRQRRDYPLAEEELGPQ